MQSERTPCLTGLLNFDKPTGITSRDVVNLVSRPLRKQKVKVGHAGTLDPLASGVLVVCVGSATRLIEHIQGLPKVYRTVVRLGATSDTLDADGTIVEATDPPVPDEAKVRAALQTQVGEIEQLPPQFSALKVGGQRAYDLARAGQHVELAPRRVRIDRIELRSYQWPRLEFEVECGGGTYIRSIVRDVGEMLGCGGLIEVLVRTRIGPFSINDAIPPNAERLNAGTIPGLLRPALEAVADLPQLELNAEQAAAIKQGRWLDRSRLGPEGSKLPEAGEIALVYPAGTLLALGEFEASSGRIQPRRVLACS